MKKSPKLLWSAYSIEGYTLLLLAKPKKQLENVYFMNSAADYYELCCKGIIHKSNHLTWMQTLFLLYMTLQKTQWEAARSAAERLTLRMPLNSEQDALYLAHWTIQKLHGEDQT